MTRIAILVDDDLLRRIESAAAAHRTTVDEMLTTAAHAVGDLGFDPSTLPPITRSLLGIARRAPDRPYKELLVEALMEKYGVDE